MEDENIVDDGLLNEYLIKKYTPKKRDRYANPSDVSSFTGFNTGIGSSQYDEGFKGKLHMGDESFDKALNSYRAKNQSGLHQFGNVLGRLTNIIPEAVGSIASALDFEDYKNSDEEVGNWLTSMMEEWKATTNEALPIYRENPGKTFDIGDSGWWFDNGSSLINSIGGFAIGGGIISKSLVGLSKAAKLAIITESIMGANKAQKLGRAAHNVVTSTMLNQAESILEATDVYDYTYNLELEKLKAKGEVNIEQKARQKAAEAASITVNTNRINILLNLTSSNLFLKSPTLTRNLLKKETFKGNMLTSFDEGSKEYIEEVINYISGQKGRAFARDEKYTFDSLIKDISSPEATEAGVMGFVGGMGQTTLTKEGYQRLAKVKDPNTGELISIKQYDRNKYNQQRSIIEEYENNAKATDVKGFTTQFESISDKIKIQEAYKKAVEEGNDEEATRLAQLSLDVQAYNSFKTGTTEPLIKLYTELKNGEQKEGMSDNYKENAQEAIDKIKVLEKHYNNANRFINSKEVFLNRANNIELENKYNETTILSNNNRSELQKDINRLIEHSNYKGLEDISIDLNNLNNLKESAPKLYNAIQELPSYNPELQKLQEEDYKNILDNNKKYKSITSKDYQEEYKTARENAYNTIVKELEKQNEIKREVDKINDIKDEDELNNYEINELSPEDIKRAYNNKKEDFKNTAQQINNEQSAIQKTKTEEINQDKEVNIEDDLDFVNSIPSNYNVGDIIPITPSLIHSAKLDPNLLEHEDGAIIESIEGNKVKINIVATGQTKTITLDVPLQTATDPELDYSTDGSANHDALIPTTNENKGSIKDSDAGSGTVLISTDRNTGELLPMSSEAFLNYEREPINKIGKVVNFEINFNAGKNILWDNAISIYEKLKAGKVLNAKEIELLIKDLPINAVMAEGVFTPIHTSYKSDGTTKTFDNSSGILRTNIVNALLNDVDIKDITSTIEGQYKGFLQVSPKIDGKVQENNILGLHFLKGLTDIQRIKKIKDNLGYIDSEGNIVTQTKTIPFNKPNARGEIYLMIPQANGILFPLKLNIKKIEENDAELLSKIIQIRLADQEVGQLTTLSELKDKDLKQQIDTNFKELLPLIGKSYKDTTIKDLIDFIIFQYKGVEGTFSPKTQVRFSGTGVKGERVFLYGNPKLDGKSVNSAEEFDIEHFKEWLSNNKRYTINIKPKNNQDSRANIWENTKYLEYLINNNILNTNAKTSADNSVPTFQGYSNIYLDSHNVNYPKSSIKEGVISDQPVITISKQDSTYSKQIDGDLTSNEYNGKTYLVTGISGKVFETTEKIDTNKAMPNLPQIRGKLVTDSNIIAEVEKLHTAATWFGEIITLKRYENIRISQKNVVPLQPIKKIEPVKKPVAKSETSTPLKVTTQVVQELTITISKANLLPKVGSVAYNDIIKNGTDLEKFSKLKAIADKHKLDISSIIKKCN